MNQKAGWVTPLREALALVGVGLFSVGLWQIFPPATFLFLGLSLTLPLAVSLRRVS